jgi:hypothetical protein
MCSVLVGVLAAPLVSTRASGTALPQAAASADQTPREKFEAAVDSLNLTDDQKAKLQPMFADARAKGEAVANDSALSDDQKKTKLKGIYSELKMNVNGVLTPEQQAQVKAKVEAAKEKNN